MDCWADSDNCPGAVSLERLGAADLVRKTSLDMVRPCGSFGGCCSSFLTDIPFHAILLGLYGVSGVESKPGS